MSTAQAFAAVEAAKLECVINKAALSAATQVRGFIWIPSGDKARIRARLSANARLAGSVFLEHRIGDGNDFLV